MQNELKNVYEGLNTYSKEYLLSFIFKSHKKDNRNNDLKYLKEKDFIKEPPAISFFSFKSHKKDNSIDNPIMFENNFKLKIR